VSPIISLTTIFAHPRMAWNSSSDHFAFLWPQHSIASINRPIFQAYLAVIFTAYYTFDTMKLLILMPRYPSSLRIIGKFCGNETSWTFSSNSCPFDLRSPIRIGFFHTFIHDFFRRPKLCSARPWHRSTAPVQPVFFASRLHDTLCRWERTIVGRRRAHFPLWWPVSSRFWVRICQRAYWGWNLLSQPGRVVQARVFADNFIFWI